VSILKKIKELKELFDSDYKLLIENQLDVTFIFNKYLGRKGLLNTLYPLLSKSNKEEKSDFGKKINDFKQYISSKLEKHSLTNDINELKSEIDLTLPESYKSNGSVHPITLIVDEIKNIFLKIGFSSIYGSEVDSDYYNFEALNIPKHHPARDMQDTFYINDNILLRTHTSGSQIHFMENNKPPIRILSPGRVYRNEDISVRSYCLFHQIEGLYVDENVSFAELKGTLEYFAKEFFGSDVKTRFRPSYFPFTEPSAEMDVYWGLNSESDYRITKGTGWLEILGCGMVDPEVFKSVKYDTKKISGFAFGLGIERIAMLKYGIDDIRLLYEGDSKFLRQFKK
jgi:phenylalanyl-tRNA synthetase alpha chain